MKIGLVEIKKAYIGQNEINSSNGFVGLYPIIESQPIGTDYFYVELDKTSDLSQTWKIYLDASVMDASTLEFSKDKTTWSNNYSTSGNDVYIEATRDEKLYLRSSSSTDTHRILKTQDNYYNIGGDILTLFDYTTLTTSAPLLAGTFYEHTKLKNAADLKLNYTTLQAGCYLAMFLGCTGLTTAPSLPATSLDTFCYSYMFKDCSSLTSAPVLPATTVLRASYAEMFEGCSSLTSAPTLSATTVGREGYAGMFSGCTSLTTAPALPATTLDELCYYSMFNGCTGLTSAPTTLPATTLTSQCYYNMFNRCSSLTTAPALPATTLANSCYRYMFGNCTGLTSAPALPATTMETSCYEGMFSGCTSLTTAPDLPATTLAPHCYRSMFDRNSSLNYIKCLAVDMTATSCTYLWTTGVSATGTFVKNANATWSTGTDGIPSGWTIIDNDDRFRLEALANNSSIGLAKKGSAYDLLQYSLDDGDTWSDLTTSTSVTLNTGDKMFIRGHAFKDLTSGTDYNNLRITGNVAAKGNIMYLYDYNNPSGTTIAYTRALRKLFDTNCTGLTLAHELIMPATTLADDACSSMFNGCTALTTAPDLPATTVGANCYFYMFAGCSSLTSAPALSATTLTSLCCMYMFLNCSSLTSAPAILPATTLAEKCYNYMFTGCSSLTSAPALPATTLALRCYLNMFLGCTSLTTVPSILPATTLSTYCYNSMFFNCSSLTSAPELPATTLADRCYLNMFYGCSSLNYIKCLATNISASNCTINWVNGVSATGTFVKDSTMSSWTTGTNGIPLGWTVQDAS